MKKIYPFWSIDSTFNPQRKDSLCYDFVDIAFLQGSQHVKKCIIALMENPLFYWIIHFWMGKELCRWYDVEMRICFIPCRKAWSQRLAGSPFQKRHTGLPRNHAVGYAYFPESHDQITLFIQIFWPFLELKLKKKKKYQSRNLPKLFKKVCRL